MTSASATRLSLKPKKFLGQNFLIDQEVIDKIIAHFNQIYQKGLVLEIGPGTGALTYPLLERHREHLYLLEYDQELVSRFKKDLQDLKADHILQGDALHYPFEVLFLKQAHYSVISNLPYNIATPIIIKLLKLRAPCDHLLLMVQKEVGMELCAPMTKAQSRGRLALLAEYFCEERHYLFDVPPEAFFPKPKVQSAVIYLKPYKFARSHQHWAQLEKISCHAFQRRRKSLANALKSLCITPDQCEKVHIDPQRRAETLDLKEWESLLGLMTPHSFS